MKNAILIVSMLFATTAFTQNQKIRVQESFFSTNYEIGDKDATATDIKLHLEKTGPAEAYSLWQRGHKQEINGTIWLGIGTAGMLLGLLAENDDAQLIGYTGAAVAYTTSLIFYINSGKNQGKAIKNYNKANGY